MQHSGIRQVGRTLLTLAGILLLIIFGTRAASQATSLAAVGGQTKKAALPILYGPTQLTLLSSDSLKWVASRPVATSDTDTSESYAPTTQSKTSEQVPAANLNAIITPAQHRVQLAADDSFGALSTDTQPSGNQNAQQVTSEQINTKLLNKSRQN